MSDTTISWFYHQDGGRKGPFTSDQIGTLIQAGVIGEHTRMWSEKLGEWTPLFRTELRALLGDRAVEPPPLPAEEPAAKAAPAYDRAAFSQPFDPAVVAEQGAPNPAAAPARTYPLRDNRGLAKVLYWLIWVNAAISAIQIFWILKAKGGIEAQYRVARFNATDDTMLVVVAFPFFLTIIAFLFWKYRSTANLFHLHGSHSITPAGAVYWYFVPIAWFWKPYQAMRNLHDGYGAGVSTTLRWWWFLFLGSIGIAAVLEAYLPDPVQTLSEARTYVSIALVILGVEFLWFYVASELVKAISAAEARAMQQ